MSLCGPQGPGSGEQTSGVGWDLDTRAARSGAVCVCVLVSVLCVYGPLPSMACGAVLCTACCAPACAHHAAFSCTGSVSLEPLV